MALISGVILWQMNTKLFVIIIFMTLISIVLVFIFKQPYKKINEEQMQQNSILNSEIIEGLRAFETIKGNANEDIELESIEREYIKALRIGYKESMLSNVQGTISSIISGIGNLVLMYVGISSVINNDLTLGSYMAFMTLAGYFTDPVSNLVGLQLQIQEANISMKRLSEIMDYEREQELTFSKDSGIPSIAENIADAHQYQVLEKVDGDIEVNNVQVASIQAARFRHMADLLKGDITNATGRSFNVSDEVVDFLQEAEIQHMKAKSIEKSDIFLSKIKFGDFIA